MYKNDFWVLQGLYKFYSKLNYLWIAIKSNSLLNCEKQSGIPGIPSADSIEKEVPLFKNFQKWRRILQVLANIGNGQK